MSALCCHTDHSKYCRVMRIIKILQLLILPVNSQCILCQIICSDTEEINFFRQFTAYHNCCRCLNHNSKFYIFPKSCSFCAKFCFDFLDDFFDFLYFCYRNNHREHNRYLSISGCTIERTKLCFKNLRSCQANSDCTISKCRIILFIKFKIIYLLVSSDI